MNLGSPDSTSVPDVRRYLNEFLMDERVIDNPYLLRLLLVRGIIVPFRAPKSAGAYQAIWTDEGSPLIVLTRQLEEALQARTTLPVTMMMRYGAPSPKEVYDQLQASYPALEELILLPLYPHYAMSSYETAVVYAEEWLKKGKYPFRMKVIPPYYNNESYIKALAASIRPYLATDYDKLLFSYHSIPERHIQKGDITGHHCLKVPNCCDVPSPAHKQCYRHQCIATTKLVARELELPDEKWSISFQSRLGREKWLEPFTADRLAALPGEGVKKVLVACPSFVSDCLETLEEIAMEGKHTFIAAGGTSFTAIPCMNVHPDWVRTVAGWIEKAAKEPVTA